jgi:hypothetical protein
MSNDVILRRDTLFAGVSNLCSTEESLMRNTTIIKLGLPMFV